MGEPSASRLPAVNRGTGEIVQLELLDGETFRRKGPGENRVLPGARYDWQPHPGRHVNVGKALMKKVWHKDSGYRQNDRDIFGFYVAHSPEGTEPLRMTFKEIAQTLGIRPDTVARSVGRLHAAWAVTGGREGGPDEVLPDQPTGCLRRFSDRAGASRSGRPLPGRASATIRTGVQEEGDLMTFPAQRSELLFTPQLMHALLVGTADAPGADFRVLSYYATAVPLGETVRKTLKEISQALQLSPPNTGKSTHAAG